MGYFLLDDTCYKLLAIMNYKCLTSVCCVVRDILHSTSTVMIAVLYFCSRAATLLKLVFFHCLWVVLLL